MQSRTSCPVSWVRPDTRLPVWISDIWIQHSEEMLTVLDQLSDIFGDGTRLPGMNRPGPHGNSAELTAEDTPLLRTVEDELRAMVDIPAALQFRSRYRQYLPGQGHPEHSDDYQADGERLVATILVYLSDVQVGGETVVAGIPEHALHISPRRGRVVLWHNVDDAGRNQPLTRHFAHKVLAGTKRVLAMFLYAPEHTLESPRILSESAGDIPDAVCLRDRGLPHIELPYSVELWNRIPGLFLVQDTAPRESVVALTTAAEARGIPAFVLQAREIQTAMADALPAGALLYGVSTTSIATRMLERLWKPSVHTLSEGVCGPLAVVGNQPQAFAVAGVPVPRSVQVNSVKREALDAMVSAVGGYPVVLRCAGGSGGVGILWVDSRAALYSTMDRLHAQGEWPEMVEYLKGWRQWRIAVVAGCVVGHCVGEIPDGDFRSQQPDAAEAYREKPSDIVAQVAIAACSATQLVAAGVDVMESPDGRAVVLEANYPFYFGHLQRAGHDVAGALIEALIARAAQRASD
jgi:hypothetical protein